MGENSWAELQASYREKGPGYRKPYPVKFTQEGANEALQFLNMITGNETDTENTMAERHPNVAPLSMLLGPMGAAAATKDGGVVGLSEEQAAAIEVAFSDYIRNNKIDPNGGDGQALNRERTEIVKKYKEARKMNSGYRGASKALRERVGRMMRRPQK
ncbi:MAG: hypothetical protein ACHQT7_02580 [Candidatus Levyibacteriota bacterium]